MIASNGNILWRYQPSKGHVSSTPVIDQNGNLYLNLTNERIISLTAKGQETWMAKGKGFNISQPVLCAKDKFMLYILLNCMSKRSQKDFDKIYLHWGEK